VYRDVLNASETGRVGSSICGCLSSCLPWHGLSWYGGTVPVLSGSCLQPHRSFCGPYRPVYLRHLCFTSHRLTMPIIKVTQLSVSFSLVPDPPILSPSLRYAPPHSQQSGLYSSPSCSTGNHSRVRYYSREDMTTRSTFVAIHTLLALIATAFMGARFYAKQMRNCPWTFDDTLLMGALVGAFLGRVHQCLVRCRSSSTSRLLDVSLARSLLHYPATMFDTVQQ
jgi:hypothetical protein